MIGVRVRARVRVRVIARVRVRVPYLPSRELFKEGVG